MAKDDGGLSFSQFLKGVGALLSIIAAYQTYKHSKQEQKKLLDHYHQNPSAFTHNPALLRAAALSKENMTSTIVLNAFGGAPPLVGAIVLELLWVFIIPIISIIPSLILGKTFNGIMGIIWFGGMVFIPIYFYKKIAVFREVMKGKAPLSSIKPTQQSVPNLPFLKENKVKKGTLSQEAINEAHLFEKMNENELLLGNDVSIPLEERKKNIYVIGTTGAGKTSALQGWFMQDVITERGGCLIDPHGDLVRNTFNMLAYSLYREDIEVNKRNDLTPEEVELRISKNKLIKKIKLIDPTDRNYAIGFNPLEKIKGRDSMNQAIMLTGIVKKIWGYGEQEAPRMSQVLRNTFYVLIENNQTLLESTLMLSNPLFRSKMLESIDNTQVLNFWHVIFTQWGKEKQTSNIDSAYNKLEEFTSDSHIRAMVGQKKSSFSFREVMDEGDIVLVRLPKGGLTTNTHILGAFFIDQLHIAAQSRDNIEKEHERRNFYVYVDEFQNFITPSFQDILSEDRKYGLHFTLSNQYLSRIDIDVLKAIFGAVKTRIVFRIEDFEDAKIMSSLMFSPTGQMVKDVLEEYRHVGMIPMKQLRFEKYSISDEEKMRARELLELPSRHFYVKYEGLPQPVQARTLHIEQVDSSDPMAKLYIEKVRELVYKEMRARPREEVENEIKERHKQNTSSENDRNT